MGIYRHPRNARLLIAYTWFGLRCPTPRWLDDNDWHLMRRHPRLHRRIFRFWAWGRSVGLIGLRYWGRA